MLTYLKKWTNLNQPLEGNEMDVLQNAKILGLSVTSDGRWDFNTKCTVLKGNSRL